MHTSVVRSTKLFAAKSLGSTVAESTLVKILKWFETRASYP